MTKLVLFLEIIVSGVFYSSKNRWRFRRLAETLQLRRKLVRLLGACSSCDEPVVKRPAAPARQFPARQRVTLTSECPTLNPGYSDPRVPDTHSADSSRAAPSRRAVAETAWAYQRYPAGTPSHSESSLCAWCCDVMHQPRLILLCRA